MLRILITDDHAVVRRGLKQILEEEFDQVVFGEAQNTREMLEHLQKKAWDVVILDIQMPDGNGIGVLEKVRKAKQPPIVIVLTNQSYPQYRRKCMKVGANFFFDKSTEFDKVFETLEKLS